jgi:hypothetical protein
VNIDKTSNLYLLIAEGQCRIGDDMEDVARDLATAFKAVVADGLGKSDQETLIAELNFLLGFSTYEGHRNAQEHRS